MNYLSAKALTATFMLVFLVGSAFSNPQETSSFGCRMRLMAQNTGEQAITIDLTSSRERVKNGKWKPLYREGFCQQEKIVLKPKSKLEIDMCEVFFGCHFERQFEFTAIGKVKGKTQKVTFFYPSKTDYLAKDQIVVDLKNVFRRLQS